MDVELLYFEECPNWAVAAARLDEVAAERGDVVVRRRLVASDEEARRLGFFGSPSFQIAGVDLFPSAADAVPGLSCRVYPAGVGLAGAPSLEQLRAAIERFSDAESRS